jgi:hypothetical protein
VVIHAWNAIVDDAESMRGAESIASGLIFSFGHEDEFFLFDRDRGLCRHCREKPLGSPRAFSAG